MWKWAGQEEEEEKEEESQNGTVSFVVFELWMFSVISAGKELLLCLWLLVRYIGMFTYLYVKLVNLNQ